MVRQNPQWTQSSSSSVLGGRWSSNAGSATTPELRPRTAGIPRWVTSCAAGTRAGWVVVGRLVEAGDMVGRGRGRSITVLRRSVRAPTPGWGRTRP
ncbi:hypothetical protein [Ornithinimicrobium kibberense]|uniref:hypothetical protein n=1 Tax=Ornithinimicrobium kibberense TaxID=282060 RepID=UPI003613BC22